MKGLQAASTTTTPALKVGNTYNIKNRKMGTIEQSLPQLMVLLASPAGAGVQGYSAPLLGVETQHKVRLS